MSINKVKINFFTGFNYPVVCPFCGTYWHHDQLENHKKFCDQK